MPPYLLEALKAIAGILLLFVGFFVPIYMIVQYPKYILFVLYSGIGFPRTMTAGLIVSETPPLEEKSFTFTTIHSAKNIVVSLGYIMYYKSWVDHLILYLMVHTELSMNFTCCPLMQTYRVSVSNALLSSSILNPLSLWKYLIKNMCHVYKVTVSAAAAARASDLICFWWLWSIFVR